MPSIEKTYRVAIDIRENILADPMEFTQGDTLNKIIFTVTNEMQPIDISVYSYAVILLRPDGVPVRSIPERADGKLVYSIGTTETEKVGVVTGAIELYDGLDRITTSRFAFTVAKSVNNGELLDSTIDYPVQLSANYTYTQDTPADVWEIEHNLNKRCSVTVVDLSDCIVLSEVQFVDMNHIQITFAAPFAGKAYLN